MESVTSISETSTTSILNDSNHFKREIDDFTTISKKKEFLILKQY